MGMKPRIIPTYELFCPSLLTPLAPTSGMETQAETPNRDRKCLLFMREFWQPSSPGLILLLSGEFHLQTAPTKTPNQEVNPSIALLLSVECSQTYGF